MHELFLGKGARALGLMKTPPGHLALKVDECGSAAEDKRSMSLLSRPTLTAWMPRCSSERQLAQSQLRGNLIHAVRGHLLRTMPKHI
eukprot:3058801-Pyramimonas_sp.AAC.1